MDADTFIFAQDFTPSMLKTLEVKKEPGNTNSFILSYVVKKEETLIHISLIPVKDTYKITNVWK